MKVENQEKLQYPCSPNIVDLFQRSGVAQTVSLYDYVKEPQHCCCILVCSWREISLNYYNNNHTRRHVLMHAHLLELQGYRLKCHPNFELPAYDVYTANETVFVHLRAIEHNESFCVEIVGISNGVTKAMPLLGIHHSLDKLFQPQKHGTTTLIPCCGILECKRNELFFKNTLVIANGYHITLHPLFDLPNEIKYADGQERICLNLKVNQQEIKVMSVFISPVGFCIKNGTCSCDACKHMVSTYYFGERLLSSEGLIPMGKEIFFITRGLVLNCESKNAIFVVTCKSCKGAFQYVGQTMGTSVKERIRSLCYEFKNEKKSRLCNHFRQRDHVGTSDWEISIIDQQENGRNLSDLQQLWMERLETLQKHLGGLNMNPAAGQKTLLFISDSKVINVANALKSHDIVFKRFPGKTLEEVEKIAPSIIERVKPKRVILHIGSLDVFTDRHHEDIADDIIALSHKLTTRFDVNFWISGLLPRDGIKNHKVEAINNELKELCQEHELRFIEHSNIDPSAHFQVDRHLNPYGVKVFVENIHDVFLTKQKEDRLQRSVNL